MANPGPVALDRLPEIIERHSAQADAVKRLAALPEDERKLVLHALKADDYLALCLDIEYLFAALMALNNSAQCIQAIYMRAKAVVERPDSDNLGRLAQALAHPESVRDEMDAPDAPAVPDPAKPVEA